MTIMSILGPDVCKQLVRALSIVDVIGTWLNASELFGVGKYQARHFEQMILHIKTRRYPVWARATLESVDHSS
jgi:hypothetical protein